MSDQQNGGQGGGELKTSTVVLTLDRATFRITIGGHTENYDEALAMLDMARRELEARIRAAQVSQVVDAPMPSRLPFRFPGRG